MGNAGKWGFQYISCYCLSEAMQGMSFVSESFQYISCYCLSNIWPKDDSGICISIHLMLLFIMKNRRGSRLQVYFNTSHVTVYRKRRYSARTVCEISIHLMLLFITSHRWTHSWFTNFNTSHVTVYLCKLHKLCFVHLISIHLMLLFICHSLFIFGSCFISIHLMLLFIGIVVLILKRVENFNTSHVTVYLNTKS